MQARAPGVTPALVKTLRYTLCDVFTERPLAGNPLAVFTDARGLDSATMQALAREMNLSETTFVLPPERGGHAKVRIFTPTRELPFAGHPTLGTAFVLGGPLESVELRLELLAGVVRVKLEREGARIGFAWMTQPDAARVDVENEREILSALGLARAPEAMFAYQNGPAHVYVELASAAALDALSPDPLALARATRAGVCGFVHGDPCAMRYFAPAFGVSEDPATGSAAGPLALHLTRLGRLPAERVLRIEQGANLGRPSTLYARVTASGEPPQVEVGGSARIVARGQFVI